MVAQLTAFSLVAFYDMNEEGIDEFALGNN